MSTKFAALTQSSQDIFHTQDLAVLWDVTNTNTLYTTIKRYIQRGLLFPIQKGMYASVPVEQVDPLVLGLRALHQYGYVGCEDVLHRAGVMNPVAHVITLVSNQSRQFAIGDHHYQVRKLKDKYLYNTTGIEIMNGVTQATLVRAIADQLYFNPHAHFDAPIDWDAVKEIQAAVGYPITQRS